MAKIDVCFSPALYPFHKNNEGKVVVIDIVRATTSMCAAFSTSVELILPLTSVDETFPFREKGFLLAGERGAMKVDGFDLGNSPHEFLNPDLAGKKIAFTTTNGTRAIQLARECKQIIIGSFFNKHKVLEYLKNQDDDVVLFCSGVENKPGIEDIIYAGYLASELMSTGRFSTDSDSTFMSMMLADKSKGDLLNFVVEHSRLKKKMHFLENDIKYCLSDVTMNVLPYFDGEYIRNME